MKYFILSIFISFSLSLPSLASGNSEIQVKLKNAFVYGENVSGEFEGSLVDFVQSEFFNHEYAKGELELYILEDGDFFSNAKTVARYLWKYLSNNTSVTPPYPCGEYYQGTISEDFTKNENGIINYFQITGKGDGIVDSCLGNGGPGMWSYRITTHFDPLKLTGFVSYSITQE